MFWFFTVSFISSGYMFCRIHRDESLNSQGGGGGPIVKYLGVYIKISNFGQK